jgi:hypothetical protein
MSNSNSSGNDGGSKCDSVGEFFYDLTKRENRSDAIDDLSIIFKDNNSTSVQSPGLCLQVIPADQRLCLPNITMVGGLVVTEIDYQESCLGRPGNLSLLFQQQSKHAGSVIYKEDVSTKEEL